MNTFKYYENHDIRGAAIEYTRRRVASDKKNT